MHPLPQKMQFSQLLKPIVLSPKVYFLQLPTKIENAYFHQALAQHYVYTVKQELYIKLQRLTKSFLASRKGTRSQTKSRWMHALITSILHSN